MKAPHRTGSSAFSLVEVSLALGVAAFCLLVLFGLLPVGLKSNQSSVEQTTAASITRAIVADLKTTPLASNSSPMFGLAVPASGEPIVTQSLYFREDGSPSGAVGQPALVSVPASRYRATVKLTPPTAAQKAATSVSLLVTWPAAADANPSVEPKNFSGSFEVLTALDRNSP